MHVLRAREAFSLDLAAARFKAFFNTNCAIDQNQLQSYLSIGDCNGALRLAICGNKLHLLYIIAVMKEYFVYIITNKYHNVLYTGMTSQIHIRMDQHKNKFFKNSFSAQYNVDKLVYFEQRSS